MYPNEFVKCDFLVRSIWHWNIFYLHSITVLTTHLVQEVSLQSDGQVEDHLTTILLEIEWVCDDIRHTYTIVAIFFFYSKCYLYRALHHFDYLFRLKYQ